MRTREEIARILNQVSNQLIELTLYDLQGEEKERVNSISSSIDAIWEAIMEEISKNEIAELSQQNPKAEDTKGYFVKGYYYEFKSEEEN